MAARAGWGEAKAKIVKWCEDFLAKNGRVPEWNEVKEGTGEGSANLSRSFRTWRDGIVVGLQSATSASPQAETIPLPASLATAIEMALSTAVASERSARQAEIDAIRLASEGNIEKLQSRLQELEQINNDVIFEAETAAEKREQEIASTIARSNAENEALRQENECLARSLAQKERDFAVVSGKASQLSEEVTAAVRRADKAEAKAEQAEAKAEQHVNAARADATTAIIRADAVANDAKERAGQAVAEAENSMQMANEAQIRAARLEADLKRVTAERDQLRKSQGAHIKREAMGAARNPALPGKISVGRYR